MSTVPDWGAQCTVTAMPSVTIQYLSDSAAIRLSRDCGDEEGERHVLCTAGAVSNLGIHLHEKALVHCRCKLINPIYSFRSFPLPLPPPLFFLPAGPNHNFVPIDLQQQRQSQFESVLSHLARGARGDKCIGTASSNHPHRHRFNNNNR